MKWFTRRDAHVDRTSCPWLIWRFIDRDAEFIFVAPDSDLRSLEGPTFDMLGGVYAHEGVRCTFEVMVARHALVADTALVEMGRIIRDADVPPSRSRRAESAGLDALIRGFQLSVPNDHEKLRLTGPVYDALYAYCRAKVAAHPATTNPPAPKLGYRKRMALHLESNEVGVDSDEP